LGIDMPLVAYGHAGVPLLMFPTAGADYLEYERFHLIDAIAPLIDAGRLRVYSINSVNRYGVLEPSAPPQLKTKLLGAFDRYVVNDVLPLIRNDSGDQGIRPLLSGASLGAYLALNTLLKHPDAFRGCVAISGSYDMRDYLGSEYYDEDLYFNNPVDYVPNLNDEHYLGRLRNDVTIVLVTGQGRWESPGRSLQMADILRSKGIPCTLELWGHDVDHDWPWWRKMLPYYLNQLVA
jgi:esterase/lipase superfamily enzyme